jgi:hypothetical protein
MKLRTLDCKNCAAPLRQEGEKLVCKACGSVFDIPRDANDIEYARTVNAEDYIRLELAKSLLALENKYKTQEQINQEKRDLEFSAKRKRLIKTVGMIILFASIATILSYAIGGILFVTLGNYKNKKQKAQTTETVVWDPGYRVTPSDLKNDNKFWFYINGGIVSETRKGYDSWGSVIFSSDEIWGVNEDPEIIGRYLITTEDSNALYIIFKVTFENVDGSTKDMYYCCAAENIKVNERGKIVYNGFSGKNTDTYDFRFHSDAELDSIYQTYIKPGESDYERFVFEF